MINKYIVAALAAIFMVLTSYIVKFYLILGYEFSSKQDEWGQLGDYAGGMLNPIFGFISVVLLIKSLTLQNEANKNLNDELKENKKNDKVRSFETLFFNMINSQKELFNSFRVEFIVNGQPIKKIGVDAVLEGGSNVFRIHRHNGSNFWRRASFLYNGEDDLREAERYRRF